MNTVIRHSCIRRFDTLGRLVIPKKIRKLLQYRDGDCVEVGIVGQSIVIDRYQPLSYMSVLCRQYLKAFAKSCNIACIICDTNSIVAARGISLSTEPVLSAPVRECIMNLKPYEYSEANILYLFDNDRYQVNTLYPIGRSRDTAAGAVILLHHHNITDHDRSCARLLADILTEVAL